MEKELRCRQKLHGIIHDGQIMEVVCKSKFCGSRPGVTVLHRFDLQTGELRDTKVFKTPPGGNRNG